jgi:hypothetical protein
MAITHGLVFLTDYHHDYKSSVLNIRRTIEHINDALRSLSYKYTAHFSECAKLEHCFYLRPHLGIKAWMLTALSSNEYDGLQIIVNMCISLLREYILVMYQMSISRKQYSGD